MPFIDLHCHILPGIDDGPSSVAETLAMLRLAHAGGTRALVATPHCFLPPYNNFDPVVLSHSFHCLTEHLQELRRQDEKDEYAFLSEITLYPGAENYVSPEFFDALEKGNLISLNASRYVLIEFPPSLPFEVAFSAVERILQAGLFPVLAHVERYPFFQRGTKRLAGLLEMGCIAQLNASTLLGASGRGPAKLANKLLDMGLVHVIGSDAHGADVRRPDLGRAADALARKRPADRIALWLWENAARILDNSAPAR